MNFYRVNITTMSRLFDKMSRLFDAVAFLGNIVLIVVFFCLFVSMVPFLVLNQAIVEIS